MNADDVTAVNWFFYSLSALVRLWKRWPEFVFIYYCQELFRLLRSESCSKVYLDCESNCLLCTLANYKVKSIPHLTSDNYTSWANPQLSKIYDIPKIFLLPSYNLLFFCLKEYLIRFSACPLHYLQFPQENTSPLPITVSQPVCALST